MKQINILMIKNHGKRKDNVMRLNTIVYTTLEIIRKISYMLISNNTTIIIKSIKIFDIKENEIEFSSIENHNYLKKNDKINKIDILFKK